MAARTTAQRLDAIEANQLEMLDLLRTIAARFEPADPDVDLLDALRAWRPSQSFTAGAVIRAAREHRAIRDALEVRAIDSAHALTWRLKAFAARLDTGLIAAGDSRDGQRYRFGYANFAKVVTVVA